MSVLSHNVLAPEATITSGATPFRSVGAWRAEGRYIVGMAACLPSERHRGRGALGVEDLNA
ncbi:MAG: hypothetical protein ACLQUZ_06300 [Rhizomicrobium sp.]